MVDSVVVLADGRRALSGSNDRTLRLWDLETEAELRRFEVHAARVSSVALLADGRRALAAVGIPGQDAAIMELETGAELRCLEPEWSITSVMVLADGRRVLSGSRDRTLRLWDL